VLTIRLIASARISPKIDADIRFKNTAWFNDDESCNLYTLKVEHRIRSTTPTCRSGVLRFG